MGRFFSFTQDERGVKAMTCRVLRWALLLLVVGVWTPAAAGPAAPVEIRLGHGFAAEEQFWLMTARPDITPNQGKLYTLKFTAFRASDDRIRAYEAGQIDGGTIPGPTALFAAEQGLPLRLVASICKEVPGGNWHNTTFLALADSGIRSARDLRGKRIGIVGFKTATELWARAAVESAGLDANRDVSFVIIPFPAMGEALRARRIDVGVFPNPFLHLEETRGGVVTVFTSKTGVPFEEELLMIFLRPEFVDKNREAVKAFLRDFVTITRWYLANPREARQALLDKRFVQIPPAVYFDMQDYYRDPTARISTDFLRKMQELHVKLGWQSKTLDVRRLVDLSMLPF
jgi:ABC-type nitrate/sulfonate/bicarbonate transport system substrate-binding protein